MGTRRRDRNTVYNVHVNCMEEMESKTTTTNKQTNKKKKTSKKPKTKKLSTQINFFLIIVAFYTL